MTDVVKQNLRVFRKYIEGILRPSYVLSYMNTWLPKDVIEHVLSKEEAGPTSAANFFLEHLLRLESEGWFQGFLDGLGAIGYTGLKEAIEKWDFSEIESLALHRELLKRVEVVFIRNIKPNEVLIHLDSCLLLREREEIQQLTQNKGNIAGAVKLVECLQRSDKKSWPKNLLLALEECNYINLVDLWKPESDGDKVECAKSEEEENGFTGAVTIQYHYTEDVEMEDCSENACLTPDTVNVLAFDNLKLRKYQLELAESAFQGKNTIVCAPTGCGKTRVALAISEHHLKNAPEGVKRKIVFMATKVPVYEQQYGLFKEHFENLGYSVVGFCGEKGMDVPVGMYMEQNNIIVLTPQILVNVLEDATVPSLSMFSMLIFDECHNTVKNHPYNVLMRNYIDAKLNSSQTAPLPQIVGLTASVGVGNSRSVQQAVDHICHLCASLDVNVISTVRENKEELERYVYVPEKSFRLVEKRSADPFKENISIIMLDIEQLAKKLYPIDTLSNIQSRGYGTQKYEQWITVVQQKCRTLEMEDKEKESQICRMLFTYTEQLRKYNDALLINEDARTKDALEYLQKFFADVQDGGFDETEQQLAHKFEDMVPQLLAIAEDESNENPKLVELKFIIEEEYRNNQETRTLLFVQTRSLVDALKKWIEETPTLRFLKPDILIGRGRRENITGMTLPSQKDVLQSFKNNSESKILIATSVADEGIDIAQCNLVLLYEYVGNVIKMIQVRGRGRAKGSKCILVTSKSEQVEKEKMNMLHEKIMDNAIELLQKDNQAYLTSKVMNLQKEEKRLREFKRVIERKKTKKGGSRRLVCGKCKTFACKAEDIKTIKNSHHVVMNDSFEERYATQPHKKPRSFDGIMKKNKLFCKECGYDWGITASYLTIENLPVIKIESFVVINDETPAQQQQHFKSWKDVDFEMEEFGL
ncbi:probable ATP-dependent RNA helicase DDX58 [Latimeria chalumnae]|uniref:RNA helicase n=1 Tax=Latimeria chalumnae TaxID=7897 RepID=H2ZST9_LATCH|nr:PREDICTED: probable ATP-dependent RNA helicase DDX58 [Latimeria chalumnae]|eukprot:XP_006009599.1 PREDICTED: probable ATP-dependent RNA helicase DDX58 [Latimeria chalumnae]